MMLLILAGVLVFFILLIAVVKLHPAWAFLAASGLAGVLMEQAPEAIIDSIKVGLFNVLRQVAALVCLGAMLGKLIADSGAAQRITTSLMRWLGTDKIQWAFLLAGFVVGIPLLYNVGFVLLVPLVLTLAHRYKLSAVWLGLPMLAALSVTHGFLPPHPSPSALVLMFGADLITTLKYGLILAVPVVLLAGPVLARQMRGIQAPTLSTFAAEEQPEEALPSVGVSFFVALLPILLFILAATLSAVWAGDPSKQDLVTLLSNPSWVLFVSLAIAVYLLGIRRGIGLASMFSLFGRALTDIQGLLMILAGAGALKEVLSASGVSHELATTLMSLNWPPLVLAWSITALIRVCIGSATVAGLTAAGLVEPLATSGQVDPNLLVLAIGAGSLFLSHVNDSGFWMFKSYFNLSLRDTFRTWTLMEVVVSVLGLAGVLLLDYFIV